MMKNLTTIKQTNKNVKQERRKKYADLAIQGTNNSSIASKRSVELLSRLNSIIEQTPQDKKIVVVNLGCGYDPLPFQLLDTNNIQSQQYHGRVSFIDIDYSDLLKIKIELIKTIPELSKIIGLSEDKDYVDGSNVDFLTSPKYLARPCDLNDSKMFSTLLNECQLYDPNVVKVFVAEVSLAYMKPEPHFKRNDSPLQSVLKYNTIESQVQRFNKLGFAYVNVGDMFQLWESADEATKKELLKVEPFDELEEFHLFCHHYVLCHATNYKEFAFTQGFLFDRSISEINLTVDEDYQLLECECPINRKFGDADVAGNDVFYMGGSNPYRVKRNITVEYTSRQNRHEEY
ncbi:BEM_collapsed_G0049790.mRNA.1.CDS.1 [Saccharomyces cerevisiae]|nr:BEM_collapsed_G0049790.mRNA.1.CDS.1 [Saccharomyces cerevisiae]